MHDLEILLILRGCATGDLVDPFTNMGVIDGSETGESCEKLIVPAYACRRNEAAHGEVVDQGVIEPLILEGIFRAAVPFPADRLRRDAAGCGGGLEETARRRTVTEPIRDGLANETFGIDCAGQVHVEVAALGHSGQKGCELQRIFRSSIEGTDGALFKDGCCALWFSGDRGSGLGTGDRKEAQRRREAYTKDGAKHEVSWCKSGMRRIPRRGLP